MSESSRDKPFNPQTDHLRFTALSNDEVADKIFDYEVEHTVKLITIKSHGNFNTGELPWKRKSLPKCKWGDETGDVIYDGTPYLLVSRMSYHCQFGRNRHKPREKTCPHRTPVQSLKIGCEARGELYEVMRLLNPIFPDVESYVRPDSHARRKASMAIMKELKSVRAGNDPNKEFIWQRQFILNVSPLNAHLHCIGEAAGQHMFIDRKLKDRITELTESGITAVDLVRENLAVYVEDVIFAGRDPPAKTNLRFYPSKSTVNNHIYGSMRKNGLLAAREYPSGPRTAKQKQAKTRVVSEDDEALHHLVAAAEEVIGYEASQQYAAASSQRTVFSFKGQSSNYNGYEETHPQDQTYSSISTPADQTPSRYGYTTSRKGKRGPKERFLDLLEKLTKISHAVPADCQASFTKLSASLINVIMQAKPLIPAESFTQIYKEPMRPLLHPRKRAKSTQQRPAERKKRILECNPDFTPLPDKKAVREQQKKQLEQRRIKEMEDKMKRFAQEQERTQRLLQELKQSGQIGYASYSSDSGSEALSLMKVKLQIPRAKSASTSSVVASPRPLKLTRKHIIGMKKSTTELYIPNESTAGSKDKKDVKLKSLLAMNNASENTVKDTCSPNTLHDNMPSTPNLSDRPADDSDMDETFTPAVSLLKRHAASPSKVSEGTRAKQAKPNRNSTDLSSPAHKSTTSPKKSSAAGGVPKIVSVKADDLSKAAKEGKTMVVSGKQFNVKSSLNEAGKSVFVLELKQT